MLPPKKIIWSLINNSVDLLIGFGTMIIVTRLFTIEETGSWILFITVFSFASKIREGLVQSALVKYAVGVTTKEKNKTWKASFIINISIELVFSITISCISFWFLKDEVSQKLLLWYPLYGIPWALYQWQLFIHRSLLNVEKIFQTNTLILIAIIAGIFIISVFSLPILSMVVILGIGSCLSAIRGYGLINCNFIFENTGYLEYKKLLQFGKHGILRELAGTLSNRINIFLTAGLISLSDTAILGLAEKYAQLILVPNAAIQGLLFPIAVGLAASQSGSQLKKLYEQTVSMSLAIFIPLAGLILVCIPFIIKTFNGAQYITSFPLLCIMLLTFVLFMPFGNSFGSIINAIGEPQLNTKIVFVNSIINIFLSFILISQIGIYGAVAASFFTEFFGFLWIGSILKKKLNINFHQCFLDIPNQYIKGFRLFKSQLKSIVVNII